MALDPGPPVAVAPGGVKPLVGDQDVLARVLLFTTYAHWMLDKVERHKKLIKAVRVRGVEVLEGRFIPKEQRCRICNQKYWTHREKYTDVNIAAHLFKLAYRNEFDNAIVVSADGDLIPGIKVTKQLFPKKRVCVILPIDKNNSDLRRAASSWGQMTLEHLMKSQLEREIILPSGERLVCPSQWQRPQTT